MHETRLSSFQIAMDQFIRNLIEKRPAAFEAKILGERETILQFTLPGSSLEIWLYSDGANIVSTTEDERYELADYNSLSELQTMLQDDIARRFG